jgi:hypothetical protein
MSLDEIQNKVRKFRRRSRINFLIGIVAVIVFGRAFIQTPALPWRIGFGLVILGTLHMMVILTRTWSGSLARDAALATGVQFYRTRLNRYGEFPRRWRIGALLFFGGTLILVGEVMIESVRHPPPLKNILPFCLLIAAWGVLFIVQRRRQRRWIKRELETLDLLEREKE